MCRWDELPQNMQVKEVKRYYDILQRHKASLILKRLFDIIVAGVLLVLLSPLLLILAVCIKLYTDSGQRKARFPYYRPSVQAGCGRYL